MFDFRTHVFGSNDHLVDFFSYVIMSLIYFLDCFYQNYDRLFLGKY